MNRGSTSGGRIFALTLALVASGVPARAEPTPTPARIVAEIYAHGASAFVQSVWTTPVWDQILSGIETGSRSWLEVAIQLQPGTDAGATEMFELALGEALVRAPREVLMLGATTFPLEALCSGPDVDDPRYDTRDRAVAAINARIAAVSKVHGRDVDKSRSTCLKYLEAQRLLLLSDRGPYS